jgi:hypothetical protein
MEYPVGTARWFNTMPSAEDLAKLYDSIQAKQSEKGVKGEKAGSIRDIVRSIVSAKKAQGITKLSQATLRQVVKDVMTNQDGVEPKLDQSYFSTIITGMYETEKDPVTKAVIVLTGSEKAPKVRKPKTKKAEA